MLSDVEKLAMVLAVMSLLASWVPRLRIFYRFGHDPVIEDMLKGTYATTFYDFLSVKLFIARNRLPSRAKSTVYCFIVLHWMGGLLLFASLLRILAQSILN
jgi:hypothetical protein